MMERLIKWVTIAVIALFVFVFVVAAPAYTIAQRIKRLLKISCVDGNGVPC